MMHSLHCSQMTACMIAVSCPVFYNMLLFARNHILICNSLIYISIVPLMLKSVWSSKQICMSHCILTLDLVKVNQFFFVMFLGPLTLYQ